MNVKRPRVFPNGNHPPRRVNHALSAHPSIAGPAPHPALPALRAAANAAAANRLARFAAWLAAGAAPLASMAIGSTTSNANSAAQPQSMTSRLPAFELAGRLAALLGGAAAAGRAEGRVRAEGRNGERGVLVRRFIGAPIRACASR
jgi:hypothetical protein